MTAVAERLNKSTAATKSAGAYLCSSRGVPRTEARAATRSVDGSTGLTADCDEVAQRPAHRNSTRRRAVTRHLRQPDQVAR